MTQQYLSGAYGLESIDQTMTFYDAWAATYDVEIAENGYATPRRCARALATQVPDFTAPVLDLGCGTGLSGLALRTQGFTTIDGAEPSEQMLALARARTGVYRAVHHIDPDARLPFVPGTYTHACAAGVISPQHAPPETIDNVLSLLPAGGCLVFSLNDHALEAPAFSDRIDEIVRAGTAEVLLREHGPHLPGIGLEATICVLRKL